MPHAHDGCSACLERQKRFAKRYEKDVEAALEEYGRDVEEAADEYLDRVAHAQEGEPYGAGAEDEAPGVPQLVRGVVAVACIALMLSAIAPEVISAMYDAASDPGLTEFQREFFRFGPVGILMVLGVLAAAAAVGYRGGKG